ncbi:MAG: hypothetical protein KC466_08070 [Myxococcales bacterium]|nr:hypothetical protein [Myxococcales bacterium]
MIFCTAINCMDGRVQAPVNAYLRTRFNADYVDAVTEPGPALVLAMHDDPGAVQHILRKVNISVDRHASIALAVAGHHDCAGNPAPKEEKILHLLAAVRFLREKYPALPAIALWVDEKLEVHEISDADRGMPFDPSAFSTKR